jgi:hypothetical protein
VTAPHDVSLKLIGIEVDGQEKYPFTNYNSALSHLLKAAQEDYELEMEWRRKTGNFEDVLHK